MRSRDAGTSRRRAVSTVSPILTLIAVLTAAGPWEVTLDVPSFLVRRVHEVVRKTD